MAEWRVAQRNGMMMTYSDPVAGGVMISVRPECWLASISQPDLSVDWCLYLSKTWVLTDVYILARPECWLTSISQQDLSVDWHLYLSQTWVLTDIYREVVWWSDPFADDVTISLRPECWMTSTEKWCDDLTKTRVLTDIYRKMVWWSQSVLSVDWHL